MEWEERIKGWLTVYDRTHDDLMILFNGQRYTLHFGADENLSRLSADLKGKLSHADWIEIDQRLDQMMEDLSFSLDVGEMKQLVALLDGFVKENETADARTKEEDSHGKPNEKRQTDGVP